MHIPIAIALNMRSTDWLIAIFCGISFLIMFGLASAKGDFQSLIDNTLINDAISRKKRNYKND